MANLSFWAKVLFVQSGFVLLYWLWQFQGVQGAGGLLTFLVWVIILAMAVIVLLSSPDTIAKGFDAQPPGKHSYDRVMTLVWIAALAWAGATFTAFALLVAFALLEVRYSMARVAA